MLLSRAIGQVLNLEICQIYSLTRPIDLRLVFGFSTILWWVIPDNTFGRLLKKHMSELLLADGTRKDTLCWHLLESHQTGNAWLSFLWIYASWHSNVFAKVYILWNEFKINSNFKILWDNFFYLTHDIPTVWLKASNCELWQHLH